MIGKTNLPIALGCLAALGATGTLSAQENTKAIEEIVVTATKRETVLQETPYSIQALGEESLKNLGATDFISFFSSVTSLSQYGDGPGNRRYAIRGVQSIGEPQVGLYYDEVPIAGLPGDNLDSGFAQLDLKLWDVNRVEVLKGPQGTLYGQGSMGGTLRIISNRPDTSVFTAAAQTSLSHTRYGDVNYGVNGMINVPVVRDRLAIRAAVYHRDEDGYIDDIPVTLAGVTQVGRKNANDEQTTGGRVSAQFTPGEDMSVTGIYYFQRTETGSLFETFPDFASSRRPVANVFTEDFFNDDVDMFSVMADYDRSSLFSATWSGSYMKRTTERFEDTTRFVLGLFGCDEFNFGVSCFGPPLVPTLSMDDSYVKSWSSELRLTSKLDGPLQWATGVFWQDKRTFRNGQIGVADGVTGEVVFDDNRVMQNRIFSRQNFGKGKQLAFFGEASYEIIDRLTATVGLRWFDSSRREDQNLVQPFFGGQVGFLPTQSFSENGLIKKFHVAYEVSGDFLVYAQAAEGFRLGGPNQPGGFTVSAPPFESDSLWNYELGWKSSWNDSQLVVNGAAYYIDWSNIQIEVADAVNPFDYITNAGDADVMGFELEADWKPTAALQLGGGLTYSLSRLHGDQTLPPGAFLAVDLQDGDRLPNVPKWMVNLSATYTFPVLGDYEGSLHADWNYISSSNTDFTDKLIGGASNPNFYRKGSYNIANFRATVKANSWEVSAFVRNVFDNQGAQSARVIDNEPLRIVIPRPRTIGVEFLYHFDGL